MAKKPGSYADTAGHRKTDARKNCTDVTVPAIVSTALQKRVQTQPKKEDKEIMKANRHIHIIWTLVIVLMLSAGTVITIPEQAQAATRTVNITKKKTTLIAGTKIKVKARFGKKIVTTKGKWTTNNRKVATVNKKGVVTARTAGTARIKVKYKKKAQVITVTVRRPKKKPSSNKTCRHDWEIRYAPNCGHEGMRKCRVCGEVDFYGTASGNHTWKISAEPTCYHPGQLLCDECGNIQPYKEPLGHDWEDHSEIYENGSGEPYTSTYYECLVCNNQFYTKAEIEAHKADPNSPCLHAVTSETTCEFTYPKTDTIQETYKTCKRCGYETEHETEIINTEDKIFYGWK